MKKALDRCDKEGYNLNAINVVGGVSANETLIKLVKNHTAKDIPIVSAPLNLCADNGVMIAWMGLELIHADLDLDIRNSRVNGMHKMPLGDYISTWKDKG